MFRRRTSPQHRSKLFHSLSSFSLPLLLLLIPVVLLFLLLILSIAQPTTAYVPGDVPPGFTKVNIGDTLENQFVESDKYLYYYFNITDSAADITIFVDVQEGDADIYISQTLLYPSKELDTNVDDSIHCVSVNTSCTWKAEGFGSDTLQILNDDAYFKPGVFYMAVLGYYDASFSIRIYVQINSKVCAKPPFVQQTDCYALQDLYATCLGLNYFFFFDSFFKLTLCSFISSSPKVDNGL